jgi:hypothetical protein
MLHSKAEIFERFGSTCCLHLQVRTVTKDEHTTLRGNRGKFIPEHTASFHKTVTIQSHLIFSTIIFVLWEPLQLSVVTSLWAGWFGVRIQTKTNTFSLPQNVHIDSEYHPISHSFVSRALSRRVKRRGKADHSPASSPEMNEWSYTFTPPHAFMSCTGIS